MGGKNTIRARVRFMLVNHNNNYNDLFNVIVIIFSELLSDLLKFAQILRNKYTNVGSQYYLINRR